jgi:hypothetical protein
MILAISTNYEIVGFVGFIYENMKIIHYFLECDADSKVRCWLPEYTLYSSWILQFACFLQLHITYLLLGSIILGQSQSVFLHQNDKHPCIYNLN